MAVENNAKTAKKIPGGVTGKGFRPGQSGNPGGRPKKKPITEIYERILAQDRNCKDIEAAVLKMIRSGRAETIAALREMADRLEGKVSGKVSQPLEHTGADSGPVEHTICFGDGKNEH
jgi:hypothetical protein